jgi:hypothetical protein
MIAPADIGSPFESDEDVRIAKANNTILAGLRFSFN